VVALRTGPPGIGIGKSTVAGRLTEPNPDVVKN
jgi:broad-specificity NMP kinase